VLPGSGGSHRAAFSSFQSSPGPEARCYSTFGCRSPHCAQFQSSPGPEARCYTRKSREKESKMQFQSSPGPEARCYGLPRRGGVLGGSVSILTGPGGPVLPYLS